VVALNGRRCVRLTRTSATQGRSQQNRRESTGQATYEVLSKRPVQIKLRNKRFALYQGTTSVVPPPASTVRALAPAIVKPAKSTSGLQPHRRESTGAPCSHQRTWAENDGRSPTIAFRKFVTTLTVGTCGSRLGNQAVTNLNQMCLLGSKALRSESCGVGNIHQWIDPNLHPIEEDTLHIRS
jgi:hypothetical protein